MAGASGNTIGSVNVKVRPDVTGFAKETKKKLEAQFAAEGPIDAPVQAKLGDTAKIKSQLEGLTKGRTAQISVAADTERWQRSMIADINKIVADTELRLQPTVDDERLRRWLNTKEQELKELVAIVDVNLRPEITAADRAEVQADIAGFREDIERTIGKPIPIGPAEFSSQAKKSAADDLAAMQDRVIKEQWLKEKQEDLARNVGAFMTALEKARIASQKVDVILNAAIQPKPNFAEFRAAKAAIEAAMGKVRLELDVDDNRINRTVEQIAKFGKLGAFAASKGLSVLASGFEAVGGAAFKALGALTRFGPLILTIAALIAVLLPPLLALGAGIITLLPAFLALGVPIGVVALGLDGIKKAAETARPALDSLKESVSGVFETGMTPGFEVIRDKLLPGLTEPLKGVASAMSTAFNEIVNTVSTGAGFDNLKSIINNVTEGIKQATPGLKAFTDGLLQLVAGISEKFPGLGQWITDLGNKFSEGMKKFTTVEDGNGETGLERLINNTRKGIEGLTALFQSFWNEGFADITSNKFGDSMKSFFTDIGTLFSEILPSLSRSFEAIATTLSPITKTVEALSGLVDGFNALTKGDLPGLGGELSTLDRGKMLMRGAKNLLTGRPLAEGLFDGIELKAEEAGKTASQNLNKGFETGLEQTKKQITDALQVEPPETIKVGGEVGKNGGIGPAIEGTVDTAIGAAREKLTAFQGVFAEMVAQTLVPLHQIPEKLNGAFALMGAAFVGAFSALKGVVTENMNGISLAVTTAFEAIPQKLMGAFGLLGAAIGGALEGVKGVVASQAGAIADSFGQAFSGVGGRVQAALGSAMRGALASVAQTATGILQVLQAGLAAVPAVVAAIFSGVPAVIQAGMAGAIAVVGGVCQQIVATMLSFTGAAQSAGLAIGASFAAGLSSAAGLVASAASTLVGAARAFFPNSPAKEGPFSGSGWIDKSGVAVGEAFAAGITDSTAGVVSATDSMMQQVQALLNTPQSAEGLEQLLGLQSQIADLQSVGASKADKAELDRLKDFNSLVQARIRLRDNELKTMTKMNDLQVDAWKQGQQVNKDQQKSISEQAKTAKEQFKTALEPLTALTPDFLKDGGRSNIYEAGKVDYQTQAELDALKVKQQQLDIQKQLLQLQQKSGDSPALQNQIAMLDTQKQRLDMQAKELEYWSKYVDTSRDLNDRYEEAGAKLQDMPLDFAKATGQQLMQDLGMSGNGLIPNLLTEGTKYIFNVAGVDDALSAQARLQNKRSLGVVGR